MSLVEDGNVADATLNLWIDNQTLYVGQFQDDWPFLSKTANLSLTDSTRTIDLPSDFQFGLILIDNDYDKPLQRVSRDWAFTNLMDETESTRPLKFWVWNEDIYLWPVPVANDTDRLTIYYYRDITLLSDDATDLEWNQAFHEAVVYGVLGVLYEREEYYDQSQASFARRDELLVRMQRFYANEFNDDPQLWGDGVGRRRLWTDPNLTLLDGV